MLHALCCGEEAGARNLVFFRVKWLRPAMKGTSCVRRLRLQSFGSSSVFCNGWLFLCGSMRFFNLCLQIALDWLHECCMLCVVGRKPERETLCFSVWSGCGRRWKVPRVCGGCGCSRLVPPLCFATSGCSCVRSSLRFLNLCLQIALEWLHECCMLCVVGRKPERETLCFSV